jgi:hypothetical protein
MVRHSGQNRASGPKFIRFVIFEQEYGDAENHTSGVGGSDLQLRAHSADFRSSQEL